MERKIVYLLLVCLVALSVVYGYSSTVSFSHEVQSGNVVPSGAIRVTEEPRKNTKLSFPGTIPLGDPIDDPVPHKH